MNILSLDTSTDVLSIALKTENSYEERLINGNFSHSENLLGEIISLLKRAGLELKDLDLAYAPPYSSAKDPVNMAGFMAENIEKGLVKQWYAEQAEQLPRDGSVTLLDVRTREEFSCGHIDGFVNIPVDELRERMGEIAPEKTVYLICQSGLRSYIAARILGGKGFDCYNFAGGYRYYAAVKNDARIVRSAMPCGLEEDR